MIGLQQEHEPHVKLEWDQIPWLPEGFKSADVKYKWAATHISKLGDVLQEFNKTEPWKPEQASGLPADMVRIRIFRQPPIEAGLVIGDIVHSLRASLDYAACALINIADPEANLRKIQFPYGDEGRPLNNKLREPFAAVSEVGLPWIEHARHIAGAYLAVLNRASNQDKHRLILPTLFRQMAMKVEIDPIKNTGEIVPDVSKLDVWMAPIEDGDTVKMDGILALRPGFQIDGDAAPYSLAVVSQMFWASGVALTCMFNAAKVLLAQRGVPVHEGVAD